MNTFNTQSDAQHKFLEELERHIDLDEFSLLAKNAGFSDPNSFSIARMIDPLEAKLFPATDHYEFLWAIYESDLHELVRMSIPMRIYVASIYLYCNKVRQWGMTVESDYYLMLINAVIESKNEQYEKILLCFLEWMHDNVKPDEGYDDYFCLLAWIFMQRKACLTNESEFQTIVSLLEAKQYTGQRLDELTVSDNWREGWLNLNELLPIVYEVGVERYSKIICGSSSL